MFALGANMKVSPPSSWRRATVHRTVAFDCSSLCKQKEKDQPIGWSFMARVTRLELATSTLARWRSTG